MKKIVIVIVCLLIIASVGATGLNCDKNKDVTVWKLATYSMPGTLQTELLQSFADKVSEKSGGRMEIDVGTTLYSMSEIFDAVHKGTIELGFTPPAYYANQAPSLMGIMSYSNFMTSDVGKMVALNQALVEGVPGIVEESATNNVRHLMWITTGSSDFYSKKLVTKIADMKGMKIGCAVGISSIVNALGGSPVEMDMSEIYQNVQQGIIDAFFLASTEELYLQGQLYSVLPCITTLHMVPTISALMYEPAFEALPEDLQNAVLDAASETESEGVVDYEVSWNVTLQTLEDNPDVQVYVLSDAEKADWYNTAILPVMMGVMQYYASADDIAAAQAIIANVIS